MRGHSLPIDFPPSSSRTFLAGLRCLFAVLLVALASLLTVAGSGAAEVEYRLGSGDRVRVTVFGSEDLSGTFEVGSTGTISYPLVGEVRAAGHTTRELQQTILGKLKPDYLKDPRITVEVLNYRPFYILGEVKRPGSYPYVSGMRVVNAIALAGGYTYRASDSHLTITRSSDPGGEKEPADHDTPVLPGDVIEVPERFF